VKLDYWILVIDDQPKQLIGIEGAIKTFLASEGFDLKWQTVDSSSLLQAVIRTDLENGLAPDLVLVDNILGARFDGKNGPIWAKVVRDQFRFTDILFYSSAKSAGELRQDIHAAEVDGVYCAGRESLDPSAIDLIKVHIRRWLAPPATRALVVGQVVEFDEQFRVLADVAARTLEAAQITTVIARYADKAHENVKSKAKKFASYQATANLAGLLSDPSLGSFMLPDVARVLREFSDAEQGESLKEFVQKYQDDVLRVRNILAHGEYNMATNEFIGASETFSASSDSCRILRQKLKFYRERIRDLREQWEPGSTETPAQGVKIVEK
jgi:hypothetical protein